MTALPGPIPAHADEPIARTSKLAIASFLLGIVCCIPFTGTAAVITGAWAIARIGQSKGRLDGRPLAIIGMALGMLTLALWVGISLAAWSVLGNAQRHIIDPTVNTMLAINRGDWTAARDIFAATDQPTDAQFDAFRSAVSARLGAFQKQRNDLSPADAATQFMRARGAAAVSVARGTVLPITLPYTFEHGEASVLFVLAPGVGPWDSLWYDKPIKGQVINLLVLPPEGDPILLVRPAGPAPAPTPPTPTPADPPRRPS